MTSNLPLALVNDPTLIKGIHEACDQWCMYCAATARCLAFRCSGADAQTGIWDPCDAGTETIGHGVVFLKRLAEAEGRASPPEIEAALSKDPEKQREAFTLDDPLERIGRSYMNLCEAYLLSRPDFPYAIVRRPSGPTPLDVVTWYHVLAPARVFRAILNAREAAGGVAGRHEDALRAAKVALVGIDRSLGALTAMADAEDDPRLELMQDRLRQLRREVERRFPDARGFIRAGLDPPSLAQDRDAGHGAAG